MLCRDGSDSVEATNRYFLLGALYLMKGVDAAPLPEAATPAELLVKCSLRPILQNQSWQIRGADGEQWASLFKWMRGCSGGKILGNLERTPRVPGHPCIRLGFVFILIPDNLFHGSSVRCPGLQPGSFQAPHLWGTWPSRGSLEALGDAK